MLVIVASVIVELLFFSITFVWSVKVVVLFINKCNVTVKFTCVWYCVEHEQLILNIVATSSDQTAVNEAPWFVVIFVLNNLKRDHQPKLC